MTKSLIRLLLNALFKEYFPDEVMGARKTPVQSWPGVELTGRPSRVLTRREKTALIRGIVLTKEVQIPGLPDELPEIRSTEERISLKITPVPYDETSRPWLAKVMAYARAHNYSNVRLKIQDPHKGVFETPSYNPLSDARELFSVHYDTINLPNAGSFQNSIRKELVSAMIEVYKRGAGQWKG